MDIGYKMLSRSYCCNFKTLKRCFSAIQNNIHNRNYATKSEEEINKQNQELNLTLGDIGSKYQIFRDSDAKVILDVNEERLQYPDVLQAEPEIVDPFAGLNLQRGVTGVFEIEDLVEVLKRDSSENIFVAAVPPDIKYVDYICIVTGKSYRHMVAIAQFVKRVFKQKRDQSDQVPRIEGQKCREWIALDLGNIALHIFSRDARLKYDLDTLWSVGPQFDGEFNKRDPIVEMLEKHSIYLKDLVPAS